MLFTGAFAQGGEPEEVVKFKFVPGEDMFYIPWEGNDVRLYALYKLVDEYREEILNGRMPVYVDGYSASMKDAAKNRELAFLRANRVKSELITHKGLLEEYFITRNYAATYTGADEVEYKDIVVVKLEIPAKAAPQPELRPEPKPEPVVEEQVEPEPAPKFEPVPDTVITLFDLVPPMKPYCFAVRTNLLYDAFLLPTLGVEWRASRSVGMKIDISGSNWGNEKGKVQKMWLVSPEVRWYMGEKKRIYLGAGGNFGEYNTYGFLLGKLWPDNTGYQGKLWNAGLTVGYQLYLSHSFSLDFNFGLGYTNFEYDSFKMVDKVRVYKAKEQSKDFWGPTQAGINLIWTIGGNK